MNLVDNFAGGFPLIIVGIGELVAIQWVYGFKNFSADTEIMMGKKPPMFFKVALVIVAPMLMIVSEPYLVSLCICMYHLGCFRKHRVVVIK